MMYIVHCTHVCVHIPAVQAAAAAAVRQATHEAAHVPVCEVMIDLVGEVLLEVAQLVRPRRHAQVQQVGLGRRGARAKVLLEAPPSALALVLTVEQALPDGRQRLQPCSARDKKYVKQSIAQHMLAYYQVLDHSSHKRHVKCATLPPVHNKSHRTCVVDT